jgi:hypothetical protein
MSQGQGKFRAHFWGQDMSITGVLKGEVFIVWRVGVERHLFWTLSLDGVKWSTFTPRIIYTREGNPVHIEYEAIWAQRTDFFFFMRKVKSLAATGIRTPNLSARNPVSIKSGANSALAHALVAL